MAKWRLYNHDNGFVSVNQCHGHFAKLNRSPRIIIQINQLWSEMKGNIM